MEERMNTLIEELKEKKGASVSAEEYAAYEFAIDGLRKILGDSRVCKDCGNYFELTDRELDFYQRNKLFLPKRCPKCRGVRKAKKTFVADTVSAL